MQDLQTLIDTRSRLLNREAGLLLLNFRAACRVGCCFSVASFRTKKKYHCCGSWVLRILPLCNPCKHLQIKFFFYHNLLSKIIIQLHFHLQHFILSFNSDDEITESSSVRFFSGYMILYDFQCLCQSILPFWTTTQKPPALDSCLSCWPGWTRLEQKALAWSKKIM